MLNVTGKAPMISKFYPDRTVLEGERTKLVCRASGDPLPFVLWFRDGEPLRPSLR